MLSPLRNRFGIPGVISVIALVFAMLGGAYAASNSGEGKANTSAKAKKGPRGPRGPMGPAGPAGPAGPQGPAGAKGDTGANGSNGEKGAKGDPGTDGDDGENILVGEFTGAEEEPPNAGSCEGRGGSEFEPEGGGSTVYACNGKKGDKGDPWTAGGTLPSGSTETGVWAFTGTEADGERIYAPISFPIQLAAALAAANVHWEPEANFADFDEGGPGEVGCKGAIALPLAPSGHLCVYGANITLTNATFLGIEKLVAGTTKGASLPGARIRFKANAPGVAYGSGSFAVTG